MISANPATKNADLAVEALEGFFNARDPKTVDRLVAAPYYQHNPLVPNGPEAIRGFVTSIAGVTEKIVDVKRAVAEGDFAAVHSRYAWTPQFQLDGGRGSAIVDIFRFKDGKIVEHWDVAQAIPETTANSHTMVDGGGNPKAAADVAANKAVVSTLFAAFKAGEAKRFPELIVPGYIQHNPGVPDGLDAVIGFFAKLGPVDVEVKRVIAQGDLVFVHANYKNWNTAGVDIFRLANGKIVEHWDVLQEIPATTASGNDLFSQLS